MSGSVSSGGETTASAAVLERGPVLRASGIVKTYQHGGRRIEVLNDLHLVVERGTILAILGASGSGKSTLLNILGTLDRPDRGTVEIEGENLAGLSSARLAALRSKRIGFVFQFHHLLPEFSAEENVMMPMRIAGRSMDAARARARELLSEVGLVDRATHRPAELSGGEGQRVAVARALAQDPDLVLADEPSGNLDSKTASELHSLLATLAVERHQTFVIATHNERLAALAGRVLLLEAGRLGAVRGVSERN
jgi:lipoprotein-releasing system ATP-binding protein